MHTKQRREKSRRCFYVLPSGDYASFAKKFVETSKNAFMVSLI